MTVSVISDPIFLYRRGEDDTCCRDFLRPGLETFPWRRLGGGSCIIKHPSRQAFTVHYINRDGGKLTL